MLQAVDDALTCAAEAEKKTSKEADKAFEYAVNRLMYHARNYHPQLPVAILAERMEKAEEEDKSSLKVLNKLKEKFLVREEVPPLLCCILILILTAAAGGGTNNGSRVSSPRVSS